MPPFILTLDLRSKKRDVGESLHEPFTFNKLLLICCAIQQINLICLS